MQVSDKLIDVYKRQVGGCFIAIGVYNFAVASGFPVAGISGIAIVFYYFWKIPIANERKDRHNASFSRNCALLGIVEVMNCSIHCRFSDIFLQI